MWIKHSSGYPIVTVVYAKDLDGADPIGWEQANPGKGYAFLWPESTAPPSGTRAVTEKGAPVVVVRHGGSRANGLKMLEVA